MKLGKMQNQTNLATALRNFQLNAVNQTTPFGSSTWKQIGTYPDGTPRFQNDVSFSPTQQRLYDRFTSLAGMLGRNASGTLKTPFRLGNEQTEARLFDLGRKRLDPLFAERQQGFEQDLANRGIKMGSDAYTREMERFGEGRNDAYNNLLLTGRAQAANESLAERNQPLSELLALLSGGQPQAPQFQATPQANIPFVDMAGLLQQGYANRMAGYNNKMQNRNSMLGGLFGLGAKLAMLPIGGGPPLPTGAGLF
jgi:hypothetical protein